MLLLFASTRGLRCLEARLSLIATLLRDSILRVLPCLVLPVQRGACGIDLFLFPAPELIHSLPDLYFRCRVFLCLGPGCVSSRTRPALCSTPGDSSLLSAVCLACLRCGFVAPRLALPIAIRHVPCCETHATTAPLPDCLLIRQIVVAASVVFVAWHCGAGCSRASALRPCFVCCVSPSRCCLNRSHDTPSRNVCCSPTVF
jgi:hypothetical protein